MVQGKYFCHAKANRRRTSTRGIPPIFPSNDDNFNFEATLATGEASSEEQFIAIAAINSDALTKCLPSAGTPLTKERLKAVLAAVNKLAWTAKVMNFGLTAG